MSKIQSDDVFMDTRETVAYVIDKILKSDLMSKGDIEESLSSFLNFVSDIDGDLDYSLMKKGVNKVYNNSKKIISKYDTLLRGSYKALIDKGAVFIVNSEDSLDALCNTPSYLSTYSNIKDINKNSNYALPIDTYMLLYKFKYDVVGATKFRVDDIDYLHCFSVSTLNGAVMSLLLIGDKSTDGMNLNKLLCDKVILCGGSNNIVCKNLSKADKDCIHRKFFNVLNFSNNKVFDMCMPECDRDNIFLSIYNALVLRDNRRIVREEDYKVPTIVEYRKGIIKVMGDVDIEKEYTGLF